MTIQISADIEETTKQKFDMVCEAIGVSPSNAISMFVSNVVNNNGIPFNPAITPASPHKTPKPKMSRQEMFGCMRGKIWMADDFDATPDDFKEYM